MKRTVNFRFTEATLSRLDELVQKTGRTRTWILEALVYQSLNPGKKYPHCVTTPRGPGLPVMPPAPDFTLGDPGGIEADKPNLLPNDPKEVAAIVNTGQHIGQTPIVPKPPGNIATSKPLTREEREAKIAAAQSWLTKGKK